MRVSPQGSALTHPLSLVAHFELPSSVRLTGGSLPGQYQAAQFHFHWGGIGRPGSEHTIDGERFPVEVGGRRLGSAWLSLMIRFCSDAYRSHQGAVRIAGGGRARHGGHRSAGLLVRGTQVPQ